MCELVNKFDLEEIRQRVDEIYDSVTVNLVGCGQACLKRLTEVVMADIEEQLDQVFTPDWIEGNQVNVAVATLTDYLNDFEEFLMAFWSDKFVANMLEAIILRYTRSVIFRKDSPPAPAVGPPAPAALSPKKGSGGGGFFSFTQKCDGVIDKAIEVQAQVK